MSSDTKITVVDCTDFSQSGKRNYKQIDINEAFPPNPELSFSRYDVLNKNVRKVYFDFDGIPNTEENENIPDKFVEGWFNFIKRSNDNIQNDTLHYVKTYNYGSTLHAGYSSHIILYDYCMDIFQLKNSVIMFVNSDEGKEFKQYADTVVYSKLRLFKLPHFIGIPMTNPENYHRLDKRGDNTIEHYIIQDIHNTQKLIYTTTPPKGMCAVNRSDPNTKGLAKEVGEALIAIKNVVLERRPTQYSPEQLSNILSVILAMNAIPESTKTKLKRYLPIRPENIPTVVSLISLIKTKYKIPDSVLEAAADSS